MIKIILIKAKWNAFVHRRMSCREAELSDTDDSFLSSIASESTEYLTQ